jgi:hypothetical protein
MKNKIKNKKKVFVNQIPLIPKIYFIPFGILLYIMFIISPDHPPDPPQGGYNMICL